MVKYQGRIYTRKVDSKEKITKEIITKLNEGVQTTAKMCNSTGVDWAFVGGIPISFELSPTLDKIIRVHSDINIEIDRKEVLQFQEGMRPFGYTLFEQRKTVKEIRLFNYSGKPILYREIDSERIQKPIKTILHLVNLTPKRMNEFLRNIGVMVCDKTEDGAIVYDDGKSLQIHEPYDGKIVKIGNETAKLRNLDYLKYFKSNSKKPEDAYDLLFLNLGKGQVDSINKKY